VKYLSANQILLIHSVVVDESGGSHGVRDYAAILGLEGLPMQKVFGKELYPNIFDKAALYTRNIIQHHPFVDGNKRTGMSVAGVFLELNEYRIQLREGEIEKFALKIVKDRLEIKAIAAWLKKHSKRI
jgi:death on curing protein